MANPEGLYEVILHDLNHNVIFNEKVATIDLLYQQAIMRLIRRKGVVGNFENYGLMLRACGYFLRENDEVTPEESKTLILVRKADVRDKMMMFLSRKDRFCLTYR